MVKTRTTSSVTTLADKAAAFFGYDLGVISYALPQLTAKFDLSNTQKEWIVSSLYIGGGIEAAISRSFCDAVGQKHGILWTNILFALGGTILATSSTLC